MSFPPDGRFITSSGPGTVLVSGAFIGLILLLGAFSTFVLLVLCIMPWHVDSANDAQIGDILSQSLIK